MAKEFVRFLGPGHAKKGDPRSNGSDLVPLDPTPEPAPRPQPALSGPTYLSREQLISLHGETIGEALWHAVHSERQRTAERFKAMHGRLVEIREQMAAIEAKSAQRMQRLQRAVESAYSDYLAAGAQLDQERVALQSELAPLNGEAETITRELHAPMHASRVTQWATTTDPRQQPGADS